jgi:hypothetical protein
MLRGAAAVGKQQQQQRRRREAPRDAHLQLPHVVLVLPSEEVDLLEQLLLMVLELPHLCWRLAKGGRRRRRQTAAAAAAMAVRRLRQAEWERLRLLRTGTRAFCFKREREELGRPLRGGGKSAADAV